MEMSRQFWQELVDTYGEKVATEIAASNEAIWGLVWKFPEKFPEKVIKRRFEIEARRLVRQKNKAVAEMARIACVRKHKLRVSAVGAKVIERGPHGLEVVRRALIPYGYEYTSEKIAKGRHPVNSGPSITWQYFIRKGDCCDVLSGPLTSPPAKPRDWLRLLRTRGGARYSPFRFDSWKRELRASRLRNKRARDGALLGWRYWRLSGKVLTSPYRLTPWEGPSLQAKSWSDSDAVRGVAGIHAIIRHTEHKASHGEMLVGGVPPIDMPYGRVRGYGRYVLGETGWRAERVVVDLIVVHPNTSRSVVEALERRYQCRVIVAKSGRRQS